MKTIILIILLVVLTNTVRSQEPCMGDDCSIVFEFRCISERGKILEALSITNVISVVVTDDTSVKIDLLGSPNFTIYELPEAEDTLTSLSNTEWLRFKAYVEGIIYDYLNPPLDPFNLTDEQIDNADRDTLLQSLVDITIGNGNTITSVEYIPTANKFQVKVSIGNGSFTYSAGGNETVLEDIHPQHFREFYKYIVNYILNNF